MFVTHTNKKKGFGLASLSGANHGYMPPRLKTKQTFLVFHKLDLLLPLDHNWILEEVVPTNDKKGPLL